MEPVYYHTNGIVGSLDYSLTVGHVDARIEIRRWYGFVVVGRWRVKTLVCGGRNSRIEQDDVILITFLRPKYHCMLCLKAIDEVLKRVFFLQLLLLVSVTNSGFAKLRDILLRVHCISMYSLIPYCQRLRWRGTSSLLPIYVSPKGATPPTRHTQGLICNLASLSSTQEQSHFSLPGCKRKLNAPTPILNGVRSVRIEEQ